MQVENKEYITFSHKHDFEKIKALSPKSFALLRTTIVNKGAKPIYVKNVHLTVSGHIDDLHFRISQGFGNPQERGDVGK